MSEVGDAIYRTTNTVRCEWCGAEPGQSCHIEPDRFAGWGKNEKFHTIRVDPTSEPIGKVTGKWEGGDLYEVFAAPPSDEGDG